MIFNEIAIVISTKEIAYNTFETFLYSPKIANITLPGQFINILPEKSWDNVMRRPMSVASQHDDNISIIYKVVGNGTEIMKSWEVNDKIDIIGPLGNYWSNYEGFLPILIGGGVGIAPIINLHHMFIDKSIEHNVIMGAQTKKDHFMKHNPENRIFMTTDDGSLGIPGNVIDALTQINNTHKIKIYGCGPPAMMEALKEYANSNNIECDLALESIMACGFGICQGCSIELIPDNNKEHSYRNKFSLICMDGPIFNAKKIKTCHI